jgi:8-oxo-dGTP diphosphatase
MAAGRSEEFFEQGPALSLIDCVHDVDATGLRHPASAASYYVGLEESSHESPWQDEGAERLACRAMTVTPVAAAIGVVLRDDQVLLVRRRESAGRGEGGAFPGGKIEPGEPVQAAAAREVAEETGLVVRPLHVFTAVDAFHRNASGQLVTHYVLIAVLCEWISGLPQAAGDALEAEWFPIETLDSVDIVMSVDVARVASMAAKVRDDVQ